MEGSRYTSAFFNFNWYIPESWTVRTVAGRMPNGTPLLLSLKKKPGMDTLSAIMITAAELPPDYNGDLGRYLEERYRPAQAGSQTTINGISTSRLKRANAPDAELLSIGNRNFYRIKVETPGISRAAVATMEKSYAVVFEIIAPSAQFAAAEMELTDSLHGLSFVPGATPNKK